MQPATGTNSGAKAFGIVLLTLIAGVYLWVGQEARNSNDKIKDLEVRMSATERADLAHQRITDANLAEIGKQFSEVETQFRWGKDAVNIKFQEHERIIAVLWEQVMTSKYPATDYWPYIDGAPE
jgi:hypothetical protein